MPTDPLVLSATLSDVSAPTLCVSVYPFAVHPSIMARLTGDDRYSALASSSLNEAIHATSTLRIVENLRQLPLHESCGKLSHDANLMLDVLEKIYDQVLPLRHASSGKLRVKNASKCSWGDGGNVITTFSEWRWTPGLRDRKALREG